MYGVLEPDGTIAVHGSSSVQKFAAICAGLGWPNDEPGYFCVVGRREDGRYHCLWEKQGRLWELRETLNAAQSRFLLDCVWVDPTDELGISYLRNLNASGVDAERPGADSAHVGQIVGQPVIAGVRKNVMENFVCALEKTREVIMLGALLIHETNCPKLVYSLRRPWKDLLQSPIIRALVCAISGLESSKGLSSAGSATQPWYCNISRTKF